MSLALDILGFAGNVGYASACVPMAWDTWRKGSDIGNSALTILTFTIANYCFATYLFGTFGVRWPYFLLVLEAICWSIALWYHYFPRRAVPSELGHRGMETRTVYFPNGSPDQKQTCKACGKRDAFDFHVSDETWACVVPLEFRTRVVCLHCFDLFARERGVLYAKEITTLYFAGEQASFIFHTDKAVDRA